MKFTADHIPAMLLALIPALINIGILIFGILRLPRSKTTLLFLYFIFSLICWQLNDVAMRISGDLYTVRIWDKVFAFGIFSVAPLSLQFAAEYTGNRFLRSSAGLLITYIPFAYFFVLFIAVPQPTLYEYSAFWGFANLPRPGTTEYAGLVAMPFTIIISVILLVHYAFRAWQNSDLKWQALIIAVGIFIPTLQAIYTQVFSVLSQSGEQIPVTSTFMTFFSLAAVISFSRYKLFHLSDKTGLELVLNRLTEIILVVDTKNKIKYINPVGIELLRPEDEFMLGWGLRNLFSREKDYSHFQENVINKALNGETVIRHENQFTLASGEIRDVMVNAETIYSNHILQGVLIMASDVTERNHMLTRLKTENIIFEKLSQGMAEMDVLHEYLESLENDYHDHIVPVILIADSGNKNWEIHTSLHTQKLDGFISLIQDLLDRKAVDRILDSHHEHGFYEIYLNETDIPETIQKLQLAGISAHGIKQNSEGEKAVFLIFRKLKHFIPDSESVQRMLQLSGLILDKSRIEVHLKDQQTTYQDLVNSIDGIIHEYDLIKKCYVFVSKRAEEVFGYPLENWYADSNFQMHHAHEDDKSLLDNLKEIYYPETSLEVEYRMYSKEGKTIWCKDYLRIIYEGKTPVKLKGVIVNITQTKTIELEKEHAAADLINRNRDLEQFTYIVSHNLRAPLANILGCTNALEVADNVEDKNELLLGISDSALRLDAVIRDLNSILSVKQIPSESIEMVSVEEIIHSILDDLKSQWNQPFHVDINVQQTPTLNTVKPYIYSIFYNLISNSFKYRNPNINSYLKINSTRKNGHVEFVFADNGKGIDLTSNQNNMFGMYKRFHNDVDGKGLGLFMVKSQIEAMQGSIKVESEVNKGTEFTLIFPQ
ncbi:MAG: PAS domain S-box protein [Bacteroidetes bacterium]|nr:PAS domain S-box protein [Bacteroidota bacterium]